MIDFLIKWEKERMIKDLNLKLMVDGCEINMLKFLLVFKRGMIIIWLKFIFFVFNFCKVLVRFICYVSIV